jgi:hypothetical protein
MRANTSFLAATPVANFAIEVLCHSGASQHDRAGFWSGRSAGAAPSSSARLNLRVRQGLTQGVQHLLAKLHPLGEFHPAGVVLCAYRQAHNRLARIAFQQGAQLTQLVGQAVPEPNVESLNGCRLQAPLARVGLATRAEGVAWRVESETPSSSRSIATLSSGWKSSTLGSSGLGMGSRARLRRASSVHWRGRVR